jgi:hypothetical protein
MRHELKPHIRGALVNAVTSKRASSYFFKPRCTAAGNASEPSRRCKRFFPYSRRYSRSDLHDLSDRARLRPASEMFVEPKLYAGPLCEQE